MKTLYVLALAGFLGLAGSVAYAEDLATAKPKAAKPIATATAPVKVSQQDKMRLCGKKGAERKTFMKGCLSKKA